jgi:aryl-alcohol dehydrogenase-like predicted oxidoreductase
MDVFVRIEENYIGLNELSKLRSEGKITNIGLSNFTAEQIISISDRFPIYAIQSKYSLLDRRVRLEVFNICVERGLKFYAYQCLESGLLTGSFHQSIKKTIGSDDWRSRSRAFSTESLESLIRLNEKMNQIARRLDVSFANVALGWVLSDARVDIALVGVRNIQQLQDLICIQKVKLNSMDLCELEALADEITSRP